LLPGPVALGCGAQAYMSEKGNSFERALIAFSPKRGEVGWWRELDTCPWSLLSFKVGPIAHQSITVFQRRNVTKRSSN